MRINKNAALLSGILIYETLSNYFDFCFGCTLRHQRDAETSSARQHSKVNTFILP